MNHKNISVAFYSDTGGRPVNEDMAAHFRSEKLFVAIVADGLGGHGKGETASRAAVATVLADFNELAPLSVAKVETLCQKINRSVLKLQAQRDHMKTTVAMALIDSRTLIFAHVGDSRVYHFRNGAVLYQSMDHSVSQLAVLTGEIQPEEIRFHVDRSKLLRVAGMPETEFRATVHLSETKLCPGDGLLLCSDGFWEHLTEPAMLRALGQSRDAADWLERMRRSLQRKHIKNQDNHSAIAVMAGYRRSGGDKT